MTDRVISSGKSSEPLDPALNYLRPVPPDPRWWRVGEIFSCVFIALLVGFAMIHSAAEQAAPEVRESTDDMTLLITSRLTVGAHALLKGGKAAEEPLVAQIDALAKSPRDRLHAAIVHGELDGMEPALEKSDELAGAFPELRDDVATLHGIYATRNRPAAEWARFHDANGWFADLALATAKPGGDPDRDGVLNQAMMSLAGIELMALAGLVALAAGGVLLVLGLVFLARGKLRPAFPRMAQEAPDRRTYLYGFTVYLGGILLMGIFMRDVLKLPGPLTAAIELPLDIALGLALPRMMGQSWAAWRAALGLKWGAGFFHEIGWGLLGYLAGLPVMAVGVGATALLARISGTVPAHPINEVLQRGWLWIFFALVLASAWAPVTEELMFRGAFFSWLRQRFSWWVSAPVVALVFAMIHPQGWVAVPALASIAIVLAGIREWRGSIIGCMAAHCVHNTITLAVVLVLLG